MFDFFKIAPLRNTFVEIFKFQLSMALSTIGYYLFMFAPVQVLMYQFGPEFSGQYAITNQVILGISSLAIIFVHAKSPIYGQYVAQHQYGDLRKTFKKDYIKTILFGICLFSVFLLIFHFFLNDEFRMRFLEFDFIFQVSVAAIVSLSFNSLATVLRSFLREDMVYVILSHSILILSMAMIPGITATIFIYMMLVLTIVFHGVIGHKVFINKMRSI